MFKVERILAMKKIYNQPKTEIFDVRTDQLLQGLNVSVNGSGTPGGGGGMHAPKKGDIIP